MSQPAAVAAAEKFVEEFYAQAAPAGNTDEAPAEKTEETQAEPAVETKEEAKPEPESGSVPEDWKHKYDVINGKFKKEVPVLHGKVKELEAKLQVLEAAQSANQTKQQDVQHEDAKNKLAEAYEKLKTEYGEEFVEHSRALARMEAEALIDERMKPLAEQVNGVTNISHQIAEERYLKDLTDRAPHWQETKDDADFHAWLSEPDEFSGVRRFDLAKDAMQHGDSARVAAFYNAFKPAAKNMQRQTSAPAKQPDKNKFVAPTPMPNGNAQRTESGEVQTIRSSDLAKFARDVIAGKYVGRGDELRATQAKYDAAQAAGKIVMD